MNVSVIGRFPPPMDGQTLATERLSELLSDSYDVVRIDTQPADRSARFQQGLTLKRALHFGRLGRDLKRALPGDRSVAIWTSISPNTLGHLRDLLAVLPALQKFNRVFAVVHRGNFDRLFRFPNFRWTAGRIVQAIDGFVFLTAELSDRCGEWIPDAKRFVIPNTIDAAVHFSEEEMAQKRNERSARDGIRVLYLSNMIRSKGYLDALESIRILRERGVRVNAQFAGAWQRQRDRADFESRVAQNGLADVVDHVGPVQDRKQVKALYARNDVLMLPTYYRNEAQPLSILEALNAGVPVISTRHGGIPEILRDGREGFLVPPQDPAALAEAVARLTDSREWLPRSEAARKRFDEAYSSSSVRAAWEMLLEQHLTPEHISDAR